MLKKKAKILIVDDEVINQKLIGNVLKCNGYEVEIASDGNKALVQISKKKFDLILSDIAMPHLDGYQMLEYMNKNNIDIPVVFLSGHTGAEHEATGLEMGAIEYIKKPVNPKILLDRMEKILKLKR